MPTGTRIGLDATLYEVSIIQSLFAQLASKSIELIFLSENLVDAIWSSRPSDSTAPLIFQAEFAGQPTSSKLTILKTYISDKAAAAYIVSDLAEIAWLLNLRGGDIPFSPVFESYLLVTLAECTLYIDARKISPPVARYLAEDEKLAVESYKDIWVALAGLNERKKKVIMSTDASYALYRAVGEVGNFLSRTLMWSC